jgi:glutathione S-transferase
MTTLYACLGSGNCFKPWLASHQLGTPLEVTLIDVLAGEQKSRDYLAINGLGVVPYLVTDSGKGIGESNAMLWYIADGSHLMPSRAEDRAEALQWMFFEQSKLEPFISPARFFTTILPDQKDIRARDIEGWKAAAEPGLHRLNSHLATREFMLASGYSVCDIAIFGYVHLIEEAGLSMDDFSAIKRWVGTVASTPNFQPLTELGQVQEQAA